MAQINAGLTEDVQAWGGEITNLPPGPYQFLIKEADTEEKSGADGETKLQLVITSEVLSGKLAGKTAKSWFQIPTGNAKGADVARRRLKSLTLATGIAVDGQGSFDSAQLKGCKYNADVVHDTYESKPDPITGATTPKTAVRIVNERPFAPIAEEAPMAPASSGGAKPGLPGLPGLTPAK